MAKKPKTIKDETDDIIPPSVEGEESISGAMPDPESDDDTLDQAHEMGIDLEEDEDRENPQELDIAKDIDKAEEEIRKK